MLFYENWQEKVIIFNIRHLQEHKASFIIPSVIKYTCKLNNGMEL